ncbi:MAG: hypothetical protein ABEJ81_07050 [Haloferacaceae archaeon]
MDWRVTRAALGYALFLSVPVGLGVASAVMRGAAAGPFAPVVVVPGVVAALAVFLLVLAGAAGEDPDPEA